MDSAQVLRILLRSWLIVGLFAIAGLAGGLIVYANTTPRYSSSVQVLVTVKASSLGKGVDDLTARQVAINRAQAIAELAPKSPAVSDAEAAAGRGGTPVEVQAVAGANVPFVTISVSGTGRGAVQAITNSFSDSLPRTINRLEGNDEGQVSLANLGPASYPASPYTPRLIPDLLLGLAIGLVLGVSLITLREILRRTLASAEDLRELTGLRVLGSVPREDADAPLPTVSDSRGLRAEAYRQVRTALLTTPGPGLRTLMVTSALAREGKTSVSTNLSVTLARAGFTVALVDADLRRPQVSEFFSATSRFELVDVLSGSVELDDALVPVLDGRLSLLISGKPVAEPSELLGRASFDKLIADLSASYEVVIVDTPPVLPVADAVVVAPRVDAVVLVTKLGSTTRDEVQRTQTAVTDAGATIVGVVANQVTRSSGRRYHYDYRPDDVAQPSPAAPSTVTSPSADARGSRPRPTPGKAPSLPPRP